MTQQLHSGHVSQINEDLCSHKNWYTNVYSGLIENGQKLATDKCPLIHTVEYTAPQEKRNRLLIDATT